MSGVLTKADTVQRGEHASWLELVEGRRHQLAHGFFVTKQPGTEDLAKNLTFQKARSAEAKFFDRVEPWNNLAPHVKRQLGTRHLVAFLSDRLGSYISEKQVHETHSPKGNMADFPSHAGCRRSEAISHPRSRQSGRP